MSFISGKKLLLLGFVVVLLVAIPLTVYLVSQQTKTKSSAEASTTLSLLESPQNVGVGDPVNFDVYIDPASVNQVGFVKLVLTYDPTKLATTDASFAIVQWPAADGSTFTPSIPIGPVYGAGTITVAMSVGGSPQNVLLTRTKIATISFKALAATDVGVPTAVNFGSQTQVLSAGGVDTTGQGGISVLSTQNPGQVNITGPETAAATETPTPTPTEAQSLAAATETPTPTDTLDSDDTEDSADLADAGVTETLTPTPTPGVNSNLVCTGLTLDPGVNGVVPYSVNITATGNSTDSTISKVSFNFGDGHTQDVTDAGGIGTNSISVLASHTFAGSGNFTVTAVLTDINGNVSSGGCVTTVGVNDQSQASPTSGIPSPSPLEATGPTGLITIGAIGVMLAFIGAILLLAI